jgi:uncharacterized protein YbaR (Trm112 family)
MDKKLLEILCCPVSHSPVTPLTKSRLKKLNTAIDAGDILYVDGESVPDVLDEALITEDGKVIYAVRDGIPVMLPDRGIGTTQLDDFK